MFGGGRNLERRRKGLISREEWKALRLRPLKSLGDKEKLGNRHFRLSADGRSCTVRMYGRSAVLRLPEMRGKRAVLLRAVAALAEAGEVNVTFRLGRTLDVTFDPMDLRRLPAGVTLQADKDRILAGKGHKARGRPRGPNYVPPPFRWAEVARPVHPEWGPRINPVPGRVLALDLNPGWIGVAVIENRGDVRCLASTTVLDHRLVRFDLPPDATPELVKETLAKVAGLAMMLCERHGCGLIGMEEGLGKLRSSVRARKQNRLINGWDRTTLMHMLERRGGLRGVEVVAVWGGYSTTIGNFAFALPDACASASEVSRRVLAEMDWRARSRAARLQGSPPQGGAGKDLLPVLAHEALPRRWKDGGMPRADVLERLRRARTWREVHRETKAEKLGVRRPHPDLASGSERRAVPGFAVSRLGHRGRPGLTLRPVARARPRRDSRDQGFSPQASR